MCIYNTNGYWYHNLCATRIIRCIYRNIDHNYWRTVYSYIIFLGDDYAWAMNNSTVVMICAYYLLLSRPRLRYHHYLFSITV